MPIAAEMQILQMYGSDAGQPPRSLCDTVRMHKQVQVQVHVDALLTLGISMSTNGQDISLIHCAYY